MTVPLAAWAGFVTFVCAMLALDLFVLHRRAHEISLKEAITWSGVWVALGLAFGALLWWWRGSETAQAYLAGYLIEKSLSLDNVFVYVLIFSMFGIPARYQHRVLMLGIAGALVMRAVFIAGGAALLSAFHLAVYLLGALLLYTAVRLLRHGGGQVHPDRNIALRTLRRIMPSTDRLDGQRFLVRRQGRWLATPLLAVLIVIETVDVLFAVDSIPAILAVTTDTFVVFTSNAFALLGMRALYFLLAGATSMLRYLQPGLAIILIGVAAKLLLTDVYTVPVWGSLAFIAAVLGVVAALSMRDARLRTTRGRSPASIGAPQPAHTGSSRPGYQEDRA